MKEKIYKLFNNKYFLFSIVLILTFIYLINKDICFGSMDAIETWKAAKSFFTGNVYGTYVMYKGVYAFVLEFMSYKVGVLLHIPKFLLLKFAKAFMFSYIATLGIPSLINELFKYKPKTWQIIIFSITTFLIERGTIALLSVDLLSFFIFLLSLNLINNYIKKEKKYKLLFIGLILGISSCLSGQYLISTYIIMGYLIIIIVKKYKKVLSHCLMLLFILFLGFSITKGCNIAFQNIVVDKAIKEGAWIPDGKFWIEHGLSSNMKVISYPSNLKDNLGLSIILKDNYNNYEKINNGLDVYNFQSYFKLIIKYPVAFIVRWVERLFLGLVADPLSAYPFLYKDIYIVVGYMSICLYVFWYYVKKYMKKIHHFISKPSIIFYAFLFSALIATFGHVENRYYFGCRIALNGLFLLTPLLNKFIINIKNKKVNFTNINMNFVTCIVFIIICLTVYCAIYQSSGVDIKYIDSWIK